MRSSASTTFACLAAFGLGIVAMGCHENAAPQTTGEKEEMQGKRIVDAAKSRQKGEDMVVEGKGKLAKGKQMIELGKEAEGKALATEGQAQVEQGLMMIRQAEDVKVGAMKMPVTTQPGMPAMPATNPLP